MDILDSMRNQIEKSKIQLKNGLVSVKKTVSDDVKLSMVTYINQFIQLINPFDNARDCAVSNYMYPAYAEKFTWSFDCIQLLYNC
jgi:hypothetical protein